MAAKKEKKVYPYNGIIFPSLEERDFYWWCEEALNFSVIKKFIHQPEPYIITDKQTELVEVKLKTKTVIREKHLLHPWRYQADSILWIDMYGIGGLRSPSQGNIYHIDTKGTGGIHDSKQLFSHKQKGMYDKYGIYVNKVIPKVFFKKTWCPERSRWTPTGKPREPFHSMRTYSEYARETRNDS